MTENDHHIIYTYTYSLNEKKLYGYWRITKDIAVYYIRQLVLQNEQIVFINFFRFRICNYICFLLLSDKFTKKIICLFPFDTRCTRNYSRKWQIVGYRNWSFIVVLNIVHLNHISEWVVGSSVGLIFLSFSKFKYFSRYKC